MPARRWHWAAWQKSSSESRPAVSPFGQKQY